MKSKQITVALFVGVTVFLFFLIIFRAIRVKHAGGFAAAHTTAMFTKWKSETFAPITKDKEFVAEVNRVIQSQAKNTALKTIQVDRLVIAVKTMLFAFSSGDYQDYKSFRFPIRDGSFQPTRIDTLYEGLKDYDPKFNSYSLDATDKEYAWKVFERFWVFSGIETNIYCSKCWKEVSLSSVNLQVFPRTNVVPDLKSIMGLKDNVGVNWWNPAFVFTPTLEQIIQQQEFVDVVVVSAIIKTEVTKRVSDQTVTSPIYCEFYWLPEKEVWLPCAFGGACSGFRKALYLY